MKTKIALHLVKGDVVFIKPKQKGKVESVVKTEDQKTINVVLRTDDGKIATAYYWREEVDMWSPPKKKWRYAFLLWLAKKLGAPVKRA